MGEYAIRKSDRANVKIGTCEDLYYLRWDQVGKVRAEYSLTDRKALEVFRFRFPFPDEDGILPGEFADYNRGFPVSGVPAPKGVNHGTIQLSHPAGYLLSLPCPEGELDMTPGMSTKVCGLKIHRNGWNGGLKVVQQRWWNGLLVTVCMCGACLAKFRLETLADAQPVIDAFAAKADDYHLAMANRILAGYKQVVGGDS